MARSFTRRSRREPRSGSPPCRAAPGSRSTRSRYWLSADRCESLRCCPLRGLDHLAGADTPGTRQNETDRTIHVGMHALQVGAPPPLGAVVRMTHAVSDRWAFAADVTLSCHDFPRAEFASTPF